MADFCTHPSSAHQYDSARGQVTCAACGEVISDQQFEFDPAFGRGERPTGMSAMRGAGFARPPRPSTAHASHGLARPSVDAARRQLQALAQKLQIKSSSVEMATGLFRQTVNANAVVGARSAVLCACLYIVCRMEKTPHMVRDFAEATKDSPEAIISYLKVICAATHTKIPSVDPSFYISRFTRELNLEGLEDAVSLYALKIIRAMSQEWITSGRRPLGVCAAAVIAACQQFGVSRTVDQVAPLARLSENTILLRLEEFTKTDASRVDNIDDYNIKPELVTSKPAAFVKGRTQDHDQERKSTAREITAIYWELVSEATNDKPIDEDRKQRWKKFIAFKEELVGTGSGVVPDKYRDLSNLSQKDQLEFLGVTVKSTTEPDETATATTQPGGTEAQAVEAARSLLGAGELALLETQAAPAPGTQAAEAQSQAAARATSGDQALASSSAPQKAQEKEGAATAAQQQSATEVVMAAVKRSCPGIEVLTLSDTKESLAVVHDYIQYSNEKRLLSEEAFRSVMKEEWEKSEDGYQNALSHWTAEAAANEVASAMGSHTGASTNAGRRAAAARKRAREPVNAAQSASEAVAVALKRRAGGAHVNTDYLDTLLGEDDGDLANVADDGTAGGAGTSGGEFDLGDGGDGWDF